MNERIKIVVRPHGHVYVGYYSEDGLQYTLRNARCIRVWGTTQGLAELVGGPTENTQLDAPFPLSQGAIVSTVAVHEVDQEAWEKHLLPDSDEGA